MLNLLFPRFCVGCSQELNAGALCAPCKSLLPKPKTAQCPHCDLRLPFGELRELCREMLGITRLAAAAPYAHPLVKAAIDTMKYEGIRDLSRPLGKLLTDALAPLVATKPREEFVLVPVPLHPRRLRQRGFNHASLLAQEASRSLKLSLNDRILMRQRETQQQAKLKREDRLTNVENAFTAIPKYTQKNKTIILVDDVITTGSTIRETTKALRRAGTKEVWGAAVAQG